MGGAQVGSLSMFIMRAPFQLSPSRLVNDTFRHKNGRPEQISVGKFVLWAGAMESWVGRVEQACFTSSPSHKPDGAGREPTQLTGLQ